VEAAARQTGSSGSSVAWRKYQQQATFTVSSTRPQVSAAIVAQRQATTSIDIVDITSPMGGNIITRCYRSTAARV